jgi:hypothetical protein
VGGDIKGRRKNGEVKGIGRANEGEEANTLMNS